MSSRKRTNLILILLILLVHTTGFAQSTQTLRGTVMDQLLQKPLQGATVTLLSTGQSVITGADGSFRFSKVAIGLHQLRITYTGYRLVQLDNLTLNAGKEMVLSINMEPDVKEQEEVVVKANSRKYKPINDMSLVSARAFTVEETQRYAAAINDPLRMATSFAGVMSADDGSNDIVIRGNAPTGLLWRMEGVDIPNPNHFAMAGSTGGGISILSSQLLANSDFVTGAFAAEYGNAVGGVFDIRLRKGNNEKREYTLQAGLLGLNLAAEGPFSKNYKGSYLINYRYSTLELLSKIGMDVATGATTNFQDLSYNIQLPTRKLGTFSIFGFGGLSSQQIDTEKDPAKWENEFDRYGGKFSGNTGATGITHSIHLGRNTYLKSSAAYSYQENTVDEKYAETPDSITTSSSEQFKTKKLILSSTLNQKIGLRTAIRTGVIVNLINFNYYDRSRENPGKPLLERINVQDKTQTIQAFAQWQYKATNQLTLSTGIHYLRLQLNNSSSIEPRASVKWDINKKNSLGIGYGLHGQVQAMGVYFAKAQDLNGNWYQPNKDLGMTKSHHLVLSYTHAFSRFLKFKTELYYQHLFDVPVSVYDSSTFSTLNIEQGFITDALTNKGKGKNYGIEFTLEKQLQNYFYFLFNQSIYTSRYTAADGTERNTRYNGRYLSNLTAGKEFVLRNNRKSFGVNIKAIYAGGYRQTPINVEESMAKGYTVYKEKEAFSLQNPAYFRTDLRLSMKWNRARHTSTLSLDIQNLTNRQNIYGSYFDPVKGKVENSYQAGLIPVLNYKIEL
ncbi:TonB-dependent receptor [Flavihumibacter rivuli]|uniref:TonB-dependent receptor n=1 Tax=Flavihumibacter rivuli TaxID=2838156 RepID=UPI001BDF209F|nr:TonB-dependent receptor [Flavihumibacter rivuli]ULQ57185.1 TonB-dependent receptor [Flavihumibacter rivuli]